MRRPISSRAHGILSYTVSSLLLAAPELLRLKNQPAAALPPRDPGHVSMFGKKKHHDAARFNETAMTKARILVRRGDHDPSTDGAHAAPSASPENDLIDRDGSCAYAEWHLDRKTNPSPRTKGR